MDFYRVLQTLGRFLDQRETRYGVIGGVALGVYGKEVGRSRSSTRSRSNCELTGVGDRGGWWVTEVSGTPG